MGRSVACFSELRSLYLGFSPIEDEALRRFLPHPRLVKLYLYGTKVSDASIPALASSPRLQTLGLAETRVSLEGTKRLQQLRPDMRLDDDLLKHVIDR